MSALRLVVNDGKPVGKDARAMREGFVAIPNAIFDALLVADIPARQMKVAMAVVRKTFGYGKKEDDCTVQQLADVAGIDRANASRAFHALLSANIISARKGRHGSIVSINPVEQWVLTPCQNNTNNDTTVSKRHARPCQNDTHNRQFQETIVEEAIASSPVSKLPRKTANKPLQNPALFDAFWAEYPKKQAKKQAAKAFARLSADADLLQTILAHLQRCKQSPDWLKDDGQYIPLPATYLNGERWADEDTNIAPAWTAEQASFLEILAQELPVVVPPSEWTASRARAIDAMLAKLSHDLDTVRASLRRMNSRIDPDRFGIQTFDHWAKPETRDRIRAGHYDKGGQHGR